MGPRCLPSRFAEHKAYTALFGVSTQDFFNFIQGDPSLLAGIPTLRRVAAWGGGFPIKVNGEVVGGRVGLDRSARSGRLAPTTSPFTLMGNPPPHAATRASVGCRPKATVALDKVEKV